MWDQQPHRSLYPDGPSGSNRLRAAGRRELAHPRHGGGSHGVAVVTTLGEALPAEIERVRGVAAVYRSIGIGGMPAATMMEDDIRQAEKAIIEGDLVGMLAGYKKLQGWEM